MAQKSVTDALSSSEGSLIQEENKSDSSHPTLPITQKTPRGSKLSLKDMDARMSRLESNMSNQFGKILETLNGLQNTQHTGGLASPRATQKDIAPGRRRPIISLNNGIDEDIVQEDDIALSLHPRDSEVHDLFGVGKDSEPGSDSGDSAKQSYGQYVNQDKPKMLGELFGHESLTLDNSCSDTGLILDDAQIKVLEKSWRAQAPEKISAYKDDYRSCFPVHEKTASVLQVPGLDDMLEPMLAKRHGQKSFKPWGKGKQLCTQPLKTIETLGYQGQVASRMNIVAIAYLQQGLGSLLSTLQDKDMNIDRAIQNVRDLFDMSTKALDQASRAGSFHHMIRRKAAVADSGLNTLKDLHTKVMFLPLSGEGVFGSGLQDKLKCRKEQKEQLSDLVPEFFDGRAQKRKFSGNDSRQSGFKRPRAESTGYKPRARTNNYSRESDTKFNSKTTAGQGNSYAKSNWARDKENTNSFRIPKKQ